MRKAIAGLCIVTVIAAALAAADQWLLRPEKQQEPVEKGEASSTERKITFAINRIDIGPAKLEEIRQQFRKEHPGMDVEFLPVKDYTTKMKIMMLSDEAPDIMFSVITTPELLPRFYLPLDDLGYNSENMLYYNSLSYGGRNYGLSEGVYVSGILYHKPTFEEAGIHSTPTTLHELYAALERLKRKDIIPMGSMVKQVWPLSNWMTVAAALADDPAYVNGMADSDEPFTLESPFGEQIKFVRELIARGYMDRDLQSSDWDVLRKELGRGKVGMLMLANYGIGAIEGVDSSEVGFFPIPINNDGVPVSLMSNGLNLVISNETKQPEAAKAFLKFWLEKSSYPELTGILPSYAGRESKISQMDDFKAMNPRIYSFDAQSEAYNNIVNESQVYLEQMMADTMILPSLDEVEDKLDMYNRIWAEARHKRLRQP